ncbi:hypothetical protein LXL04_023376 [Taraxacum kok-saghyz]
MNTIDPGPDSMQQSENAYLTTSKFDSYEELVKSVREFYYTKGYGISIRGSNSDKYVILQCDRGGSYRDIREGGFTYDIIHNPEGRISRLFIAHPLSIKLAKHLSNIFVMDCTYKTSKYNMPLLDIIGVSCFNTSFYSGFTFLEKEDEENYAWALRAFKKIIGDGNELCVIMSDRELALMNAINNVFPATTNLLSVWHIEKNVLANCKKYFGTNEAFDLFMSIWNNVIYSTTEALFESNWGGFESMYEEKKDALDYIKSIWLPWKETFVAAWTDKYMHLGNRCSSRAEGPHAKLKQYLQVSTGDLRVVKEKICLAVEHEFNEIKVKLSNEKLKLPHDGNVTFFRDLYYHVSQFALKEIHTQYKVAKDGIVFPCTGHYMATMGLPCAHYIKHWKGSTYSLNCIHPQWRIDTILLNSTNDLHDEGTDRFDDLLNELRLKYQMWPLNKKEDALSLITKLVNEYDTVFEPVIQRPKGRPPKSKKKRGVTSTTRFLSGFELVESSQRRTFIDLNAYPFDTCDLDGPF